MTIRCCARRFAARCLAFCGVAFSVAEYVRGETLRVPADFPSIQAGIDAAVDGDVVLVADGVYTDAGSRNVSFRGKAITVQSENGPANCILGQPGHKKVGGFVFTSGETRASILDGFTIQDRTTDVQLRGGTAISCVGGSPTVRNCVIRNCEAKDGGQGGGVEVLSGASPLFERCTFIGNRATGRRYRNGSGGATYVELASVEFTHCVFDSNQSITARGPGTGGALAVINGNATLTNCLFVRNNCTSRTRQTYSGAIHVDGASVLVMSTCTVADNVADNPPGIRVEPGGSGTMINCIVRDVSNITRLTITYSDVVGATEGVGDFDADPLFVLGPGGLPYFLSQTAAGQDADSPCVDTGSDTAVNLDLDDLTTRTDEAPDDGVVDLGFHFPRGS